MRKSTLFFLASMWAVPLGAPAAQPQTIELKDGGKLAVDKGGKALHLDARGRRVRMKDGVAMEAKDGAKYVMRNDALWKKDT